MNLPEEFQEDMKKLLGNEYGAFLASLEEGSPLEGIRRNSLKISEDEFLDRMKSHGPVLGDRIPWCPTGWYYLGEEGRNRLSLHPWYHAGLYYFQEPSAMYPAELLDPQPGEKVLDLCAAPGGKTTQLGMKMMNQGLLVANEINPKRARALEKNIQLYGISNCIITNSTGKHLLETYGSYFDRVLVDAPCSGEGTFRRDPRALREYMGYRGEELEKTQRDILHYAARLLKPGGLLVYSTCTFNIRENEEAAAMLADLGFVVEAPVKEAGMGDGIPIIPGHPELQGAVRFWPHRSRGEGHFAIRMRKTHDEEEAPIRPSGPWKRCREADPAIRELLSAIGLPPLEGYIAALDGELHLMKEPYPYSLRNKPLSLGLRLGEWKGKSFQPGHSYLLAMEAGACRRTVDLLEEDADRYIKGETLNLSLEDGWHAASFQGHYLGWIRVAGGFIKNQYPKNWRKSY